MISALRQQCPVIQKRRGSRSLQQLKSWRLALLKLQPLPLQHTLLPGRLPLGSKGHPVCPYPIDRSAITKASTTAFADGHLAMYSRIARVQPVPCIPPDDRLQSLLLPLRQRHSYSLGSSHNHPGPYPPYRSCGSLAHSINTASLFPRLKHGEPVPSPQCHSSSSYSITPFYYQVIFET